MKRLFLFGFIMLLFLVIPASAVYLQVENGSTVQSSRSGSFSSSYDDSMIRLYNLTNIYTQDSYGVLKFQFICGNIYTLPTKSYCRIYKNNEPFGTMYNASSASEINYNVTEYITGALNASDVLSVYGARVQSNWTELSFNYSTVSILSPANNSAQTSRALNVTWTSNVSTVRVQASTNASFSTLLWNATTTDGYYNATVSTGLIYVRAKGEDAGNNSETNWSVTNQYGIYENLTSFGTGTSSFNWSTNGTQNNFTFERGYFSIEPEQIENTYISYYRLDGNRNDENRTTNNNLGNTNITWNSSGKYRVAAQTFGGDGNLWKASVTNLGIVGDSSYTLMAWVYPIAYVSDSSYISYGEGVSNRLITMSVSSNNKIYSVHYGNDHEYNVLWQTNQWQHVAIVYDSSSSTESLYVDGVFRESWTPTNLDVATGKTLLLFKSVWNSVVADDALLDDVRIYNIAISNDQINNSMYQNSSSPAYYESIIKDVGTNNKTFGVKYYGRTTTSSNILNLSMRYSSDNSSWSDYVLLATNPSNGTIYSVSGERFVQWRINQTSTNYSWNTSKIELLSNDPDESLPNSSNSSVSLGDDSCLYTVGKIMNHNLEWSGAQNLSYYIFSFDNGNGAFVNDSIVYFSNNWSNVSKTINFTIGSTIRWKVYATNVLGNSNVSGTFTYQTGSCIKGSFISHSGFSVNTTSNLFVTEETEWNQVRDPVVLNMSEYPGSGRTDLIMYYWDGSDDIWFANSSNGYNWGNKTTPLLDVGALRPWAVYNNSKYYIFVSRFTTFDFVRYVSDYPDYGFAYDGIVLSPNASNWENNLLAVPSIDYSAQTQRWELLYSAGDYLTHDGNAEPEGIGLAYANNITDNNWTKYSGNPVIYPNYYDGAWNSRAIMAMRFKIIDGIYHGFYHAGGFADDRSRIGYTTTNNSTVWDLKNDDLIVDIINADTPTGLGSEHLYTVAPWYNNGNWTIFFNGRNTTQTNNEEILRADFVLNKTSYNTSKFLRTKGENVSVNEYAQLSMKLSNVSQKTVFFYYQEPSSTLTSVGTVYSLNSSIRYVKGKAGLVASDIYMSYYGENGSMAWRVNTMNYSSIYYNGSNISYEYKNQTINGSGVLLENYLANTTYNFEISRVNDTHTTYNLYNVDNELINSATAYCILPEQIFTSIFAEGTGEGENYLLVNTFENELQAPTIYSTFPSSPVSQAPQTFNISFARIVDSIKFEINGTIKQWNNNSNSGSYTNSTAGTGIYNVTATGCNAQGCASFSWIWTVDGTAPTSVTNVVAVSNTTHFNMSWTNPVDADFSYTYWLNGSTWAGNLTNTSLNISGGSHEVKNYSAQTVDTFGNMNGTKVWFNGTIQNQAITLSGVSSSYSLTSGATLAIDAGYSDPDGDTGTFQDNSSLWNIDTSTGVVSWVGVEGDYDWQIGVSDGYGSVAYQNFTVTVSAEVLYPNPVTNCGAVLGYYYANVSCSAVQP